jgi:OFA family oxalate/formate antiporter-like MFS transporter
MRGNAKTKITRWPYLAAGVVSMLFTGIIYAWSILKAPIGEAFGWTAAQLSLNFTLTMCFFCFGGVVAGILTKRSSPKVVLIIAAIFSCAGFVMTSRLSGQLVLLYLSYGVLSGFGIGMAYNVLIASISAWFPDKKGFCSGALMMGFGSSALILGNIAGTMIYAPSIGWRSTYFIFGILMGAVLLIAAFVMRFPPLGTELPKSQKKPEGPESFELKDYSTVEMMKRASFWMFFTFSISIAAVGNTVISFARDLALSVGASIGLATTLVGVLSVCNGLGRIFCGLLFDNWGRRKTMLFASCLAILASGVTLIAVLISSLPLGVISLCLTGIVYGCGPTIGSAFVSAFYGTKYFGMNFSIANTMLVPASFIATLGSVLQSMTKTYAAPFTLLLGLAVVSLILNLNIKRP